MSEILFFCAIIILYVAAITYIFIQREKVKEQIAKLVEQAGGRNIDVQCENMWMNKGTFYFTVSYFDTNNSYQTHHVSSKLNFWGLPTGDLYWDKPLPRLEPSIDNTRLASKEQIISDMDAEIKRLQEELARVQKEAE